MNPGRDEYVIFLLMKPGVVLLPWENDCSPKAGAYAWYQHCINDVNDAIVGSDIRSPSQSNH